MPITKKKLDDQVEPSLAELRKVIEEANKFGPGQYQDTCSLANIFNVVKNNQNNLMAGADWMNNAFTDVSGKNYCMSQAARMLGNVDKALQNEQVKYIDNNIRFINK